MKPVRVAQHVERGEEKGRRPKCIRAAFMPRNGSSAEFLRRFEVGRFADGVYVVLEGDAELINSTDSCMIDRLKLQVSNVLAQRLGRELVLGARRAQRAAPTLRTE